ILPVLLSLLVLPAVTLFEPQQYHEPAIYEQTMPAEKSGAMFTPLLPAAGSGYPALGLATLPLPIILGQQAAPPSVDRMGTVALLMPVLALFYIMNIALSITLIVAGWRMRQLKSHGLSLVAAIMAMLPCTFGWIVGLPMGIWAFSVLQSAEVRAAFET
ncbi:MAG TPA: hypothetical protein VFB80_20675, partial [Pirellulaceae bacterium]|nr:hypothetical protein [Pirellulaceae bacterium]